MFPPPLFICICPHEKVAARSLGKLEKLIVKKAGAAARLSYIGTLVCRLHTCVTRTPAGASVPSPASKWGDKPENPYNVLSAMPAHSQYSYDVSHYYYYRGGRETWPGLGISRLGVRGQLPVV